MQLCLIKNPDCSRKLAYDIARIVYAHTGATSLRVIEAMTSMISNASKKTGREISEIISDSEIFSALRSDSKYHTRMSVPANCRAFQTCLRTAWRMLHNNLPDMCFGATCFHDADEMPTWATSRGYILDTDGLLFYI